MKLPLSGKSLELWGMFFCCALVPVIAASCGTKDHTSETVTQQAPLVARPSAEIDPAKIEDCGGFTVDDAAELLGAAPEDVALTLPAPMNSPELKTCAFEDEETGLGISYSLTWTDTADEMAEQFVGERQMLGVAQTSIDAVTGSDSDSPASYEIAGIGDEAFFAAVNGTIVVRVANVRLQVLNAPDLEMRKMVAERVASRLR